MGAVAIEKTVEGDSVKYASGASRSSDAEGVRFDLVSPVGHRRLAARYAMGAVNRGDRNWEGGMPASDVINHLERHLNLWKSGDTSDDHLAAAAWGLFALMHFEELKPEVIDLPSRRISGR